MGWGGELLRALIRTLARGPCSVERGACKGFGNTKTHHCARRLACSSPVHLLKKKRHWTYVGARSSPIRHDAEERNQIVIEDGRASGNNWNVGCGTCLLDGSGSRSSDTECGKVCIRSTQYNEGGRAEGRA